MSSRRLQDMPSWRLQDVFKTNKCLLGKLFIHFEAEIQQNEVSIFIKKTPEIPDISITEALMISSTNSPKEKTGLHLGNIRQHNKFIKFSKQHKLHKLSACFYQLIMVHRPSLCKLKSRSGDTFPEFIQKNSMNFNKPSELEHKAKLINSSDTHIKVNNLLEYLDRSFESTQRRCIPSMRSCFKVFRIFRQSSNQSYWGTKCDGKRIVMWIVFNKKNLSCTLCRFVLEWAFFKNTRAGW